MNIEKWASKNVQSLAGKTVVITGATGGLGEELCMYLAKLQAKMILLCRSNEKFLALRDKILKNYPHTELLLITVDLENIDEVKVAAEKLVETEADVLLLNAGAYSIPRRVTSTGYNNIFTINFISQYYLVRRLLPLLKERSGRVVAVSSIAHNYSKTSAEDIDFQGKKAASLVYGNAKRYLTYSLQELFNREKGVELAVVHPGISFTNITAHYPKPIFSIIKYPMKLIFMKPQKACLSGLMGIFKCTPPNFWIGPWVFNVWGIPNIKPLKTAKQEEISAIFQKAEEIYLKQVNSQATKSHNDISL